MVVKCCCRTGRTAILGPSLVCAASAPAARFRRPGPTLDGKLSYLDESDLSERWQCGPRAQIFNRSRRMAVDTKLER